MVDGGKAQAEVLADLSVASREHSQGVDVLAVGQKGTLAALRAAAELGRDGSVPTFTLSQVGAEEVKASARSGFRVDGWNNYRLALAPADAWASCALAPGSGGAAEPARLIVGNETEVQPLAKAVAARVGALPEGGRVAVETALGGGEERRRLRIAKLAKAVARAYGWQVAPNDASLPTRPFRCAVAIVDGEDTGQAPTGRLSGSNHGTFLRLELLPEGPRAGGDRLTVADTGRPGGGTGEN